MAIIPYEKKYTETLACMLERFRREQPEFKDSKITYAGRLDPMAEGIMLLLVDEDVHQKNQFLGLDKVYEVEFFFGVQTDSYDILGVIDVADNTAAKISTAVLEHAAKELKNITTMQYPPYSSKTVNGKPLWLWAREGRLEQITIPTREVSIHTSVYKGHCIMSSVELAGAIDSAVSNVEGDFRQKDIRQSWNNFFEARTGGGVDIHTLELHVSSGTYIRSLIQLLAQGIGQEATVLKINRKTIGSYTQKY